ncbi:MAG: NosD domain-containing protein [Thermoplasmata archaeon]
MKTRLVVLLLLSISFSAIMILPETARATTLYVGGAGPGNHTTIQGAIDAASPGDTVYVYSGTYEESVWVYTSLSIIGENRDNTTIDANGSSPGIWITADWVNITGFTVTNSGSSNIAPAFLGIKLEHAHNCLIAGNNISGNHQGIYAYRSNGTIMTENIVSGNYWVWTAIQLIESHEATIFGNQVVENHKGIGLYRSHSATLSMNNVSDNFVIGIHLQASNNSRVSGNIMANQRTNLLIEGTDGALVSGNTISRIHPFSSDGIHLSESTNITLEGNAMSGVGVRLSGDFLQHWNTHSIDTSNIVNGKPVRYWKNGKNYFETEEAGQMIFANWTFGWIGDADFVNSSVGISLGFSNHFWIQRVNVSGNSIGMQFRKSSHNTLLFINTTRNGEGIVFHSSAYFRLENGNISDNSVGIQCTSCHEDTITHNIISGNADGIVLDNYSIYNLISGNNLLDNVRQANDTSTFGNHWSGNYWSDYDDSDEHGGPNQDQPGSDGVGDVPHNISGGPWNDSRPVMDPLRLPANLLPQCQILTSLSSDLSGVVVIEGTAGDLDGSIEKVEIRIDDGPWTEVNGTTAWSSAWDTSTVSNGRHTIEIRAFDGEAYTTIRREVNVKNRGPGPLYTEAWVWVAVGVVAMFVTVALVLERRSKRKERE